jgi:DNA invertase Pin-like site-specific DNA recombinase
LLRDTGRKPALTPEQARQLRERAAAGEQKSLLAKEFGISRETVYSYLRTASVAGVTG